MDDSNHNDNSTDIPTASANIVTQVVTVVVEASNKKNKDFWIGFGLAVSSSIFIGTSFIVKKKGLLRVARNSNQRAGSGGYGYLMEWLWWTGLVTMIVGEAANFTAYGFAPAILVTPLGALSVIVSAMLSSVILKERLNIHGKLGCFLCILGSTIIVINAPSEKEVENLQEIGTRMADFYFIAYTLIVIGAAVYLIFYIAPVYGQKNIMIYILICSLVGSLSVMACKGLSIALKLTISGNNQIWNPLAWFFVVSVCICIITQMNYLNKALDIFNTSLVTPIYYVMFTSFTIVASAILFQEWYDVSGVDAANAIMGFLTIICGVFLLHAFKDLKFTLDDLIKLTRQNNNNNNGPSSGAVNSQVALEMANLPNGIVRPKRTNSSPLMSHVPGEDGGESDAKETDIFISRELNR